MTNCVLHSHVLSSYLCRQSAVKNFWRHLKLNASRNLQNSKRGGGRGSGVVLFQQNTVHCLILGLANMTICDKETRRPQHDKER